MEDSHLLPQPVFALAQRADPSPDRGDMLPDGEVEPLHKGGINLSWLRVFRSVDTMRIGHGGHHARQTEAMRSEKCVVRCGRTWDGMAGGARS